MTDNGTKPPTSFTVDANAAAQISFDDPGDFERATRGLVAQLDDGRVTLDDHVVWDMVASWQLTERFAGYVKVDNLLDEVYVAARRPAGVRPGLPRTAYLGLTVSL